MIVPKHTGKGARTSTFNGATISLHARLDRSRLAIISITILRQETTRGHAHLRCLSRGTSCYWSVLVCWRWRHDWSNMSLTAVIPGVCRLALQHDVTRNDVIREGRQTRQTRHHKHGSLQFRWMLWFLPDALIIRVFQRFRVLISTKWRNWIGRG